MSGFFSGTVEPFWPHAALLTIAIAASFAVAAGIVLENPKWSLANVLVVGGVAIEAACTLLLFGFDEGISGRQQASIVGQQISILLQQDSIIALARLNAELSAKEQETEATAAKAKEDAAGAIERAAQLEKETVEAKLAVAGAEAKAAMASQKAAEAELALETFKQPRRLTATEITSGVDALWPFAGTPFDLGVNPSPEPQALMGQIASMLESAGWVWVKPANMGSLFVDTPHKPGAKLMTGFVGLGVEIDQSKAAEWTMAEAALVIVLRALVPGMKANIAMDGSAAPNAIHIYVGTKQ